MTLRDFVGLKSKMNSFIDVYNEENKKKGVSKDIVKNIRHKDYIHVLFNKKIIRDKMRIIQSKLHKIGTYGVFKISYSWFDDKRYLLDGVLIVLLFFITIYWKINLNKIKIIIFMYSRPLFIGYQVY